MKQRVMVVEDDAESRRALSELLDAEGFEAIPFACGETAWQALVREQAQVDIVVADVRMPSLDGMALLRRIKDRFPGLPVILVSAFADDQAWSEGLRAGALDVFPKPIRGAALVRTLRREANPCRP